MRGCCSTACWNRTRTKGVDGYRSCKECSKKFPYRNSLIKRGIFSKSLGVMVGRRDQVFCSFPCAISFRNNRENPAKTAEGRKKISEAAKKRDHSYLRTPEAKAKQRASITGEGHWNWQGGKTPENKRRRNQKELRDWRNEIFKRDNWTCQICFKRGGKLNADHIKPWSVFPEYRYELSNGRTLCVECHRQTDTYMGRIYKKYGIKKRP